MSGFTLSLKKFAKKGIRRLEDAQKKIVLEVDEGLVLSTPVDTGRARGGWNIGLNDVNLSETSEDKTGQSTLAEHENVVQNQMELGDQIFLSNNVEYIEYLNDGSSDQAPHGMVEKTMQRFPSIVRNGVNDAKRKNP